MKPLPTQRNIFIHGDKQISDDNTGGGQKNCRNGTDWRACDNFSNGVTAIIWVLEKSVTWITKVLDQNSKYVMVLTEKVSDLVNHFSPSTVGSLKRN